MSAWARIAAWADAHDAAVEFHRTRFLGVQKWRLTVREPVVASGRGSTHDKAARRLLAALERQGVPVG